MLKKLGIFLALGLMVFAAACSGQGSAQTVGNTTARNVAGTPGVGNRPLNQETKLLVGIYKLEGTSQAVTKDQAATLLPLWKAVKSLSASTTTSQAEMDALYKQIQDALTADQVKAIDAAGITNESVFEVMQKMGITPVAGAGGFRGTPMSTEQIATLQARRQSQGGNGGGFPAGGPPDGGPGGGFGGGTNGGGTAQSNGTAATAIANRGGFGGGRTNTALVDALIKLLTERAG